MYNYKFEDLPQAIGLLHEKLDRIEKKLEERQPVKEEGPDLLTVSEAAALLTLAVPTVYSKVCQREIPFSKRGKRLYFSKKELLDWIASGKKKTAKELEQEALSYLTNVKRRR